MIIGIAIILAMYLAVMSRVMYKTLKIKRSIDAQAKRLEVGEETDHA